MALFRITAKKNKYFNEVKLEKGMSVEVSSKYSNPLTTNGGNEVEDAFMGKYAINLKENEGGSFLNSSYFEVEKIK